MPFKSYRAYVEAQSLRNPCLLNLHTFLSNPDPSRNVCRIASLDFFANSNHPISRPVNPDNLWSELQDPNSVDAHREGRDEKGERITNRSLHGRILIIEDLTEDVVELLGSNLDIDPLFFALHLHSSQKKGSDRQSPDQATLPSRLRKQSYTNILYHRTITFDTETPPGVRLLRDSNVDRKVMILPSTNIGLAQHCASIIQVTPYNNYWIALVLVDPPIGDEFMLEGRGTGVSFVKLASQPFLGGYEDFMEPPSFFDDTDRSVRPLRQGLFQDLLCYWALHVPSCFNAENPTLVSLSYYPLKIVAAEWVKYIAVMHHSIKKHEYSVNNTNPNFVYEVDKLNSDLRALQSWRRRSLLSLQKIRAVVRLLRWQTTSEHGHDCLNPLIEDYEHIAVNMQDAGHRLESMLPMVTSFVQIVDTRRSFAETANISRLTILALIFGPLSFVSSLFGMNPENAPGHPYFWVYFAVAVPVTLVVYLVARPPSKELRVLFDQVTPRKRRPYSPEGAPIRDSAIKSPTGLVEAGSVTEEP